MNEGEQSQQQKYLRVFDKREKKKGNSFFLTQIKSLLI